MSDAIVVGAGPTGLMLASELALAGVKCLVLEQRAQESNLTRAFGLHARTLEHLDMRGLAETIVAQGLRVPEIRPNLGRHPLRLSMRHPESRFPYVLIVPQARTEAMLAQHALSLGVEFVRGVKLVDVKQDADGVTAVVENGQTFRARYLVGCDGAHSRVRERIGVGFSGSTYSTHILLADLRLDGADQTAVQTFVGRDGLVLMPPFGDGWVRAVIWDRKREHVPLEEPLGIEEVSESLHRLAGRDLAVREMRWSTRFQSDRRQAERYQIGRVFLAGDAAHIHSPLGALGMNTGIQDAMNLGWKLAAAVDGRAPAWLLESYHDERHPVGAAALRLTDVLQRISVAPAAIRAIRPFVARGMLGIPPVRNRLRRMVSGLSIRYRPRDPKRAHPWEGRRAPDSLHERMCSGTFLLVRRDEVGGAATWPAVMLIRPDGYVAWASDTPGGEDAAIAQWGAVL